MLRDTVHHGTVPPLALFCIVALAPYTDQLHALGAPRVPYRDLLMHPVPVRSHDLDLSLSDTHLPLLQQIPSTPNFTLITLLSLPGCAHISDDTVSELRRLNTLIALDLRATHLTTYGVTVLSRGLSSAQDDSGLHKKAGPWGLRIISLHGCTKVTDAAFAYLRLTNCTRAAVKKQLGVLGFQPSRSRTLFHPSKISVSLCSLEEMAATSSPATPLYPSPPESVFRIHINKLSPSPLTNSQSKNSKRSLISSPPPFTLQPQPAADAEDNFTSVPSNAVTSSLFAASDPTRQRPSSPPSFYRDTGKKTNRPFQIQHAQFGSSEPDPLAVVRFPPPWNLLETSSRPLATNTTSYKQQRDLPCFNGPVRIGKRNAAAVKDVANMLANKRLRRQHSPASFEAVSGIPTESRNPFAKQVTSVFSESSPRTSKHPNRSQEEPHRPAIDGVDRPDRLEGSGSDLPNTKPLKPITSLRVPVLPKEFLPELKQTLSVQNSSRPKVALKQSRLSFPPL
ncbi:hypothetical protein F5J12DRAFT_805078 [Pisolithus orientalis]|uniref:uncharacterized protein n=1 Tax=Pisolithus orientalis TaxID=936130 RepID=UPI0022259525|nr:uncharacterized protein F5J12DRAFT_805078 [Pisolithus orientalis]KAI6028389.1 hypothetical protein F5J12DRAFT_805078 [Pisolithus orientalis]